ncbi:hypothetical protein HGM15179_018429 [Zosterops borbonicus]|uniref:Uncharacterized protein n=1 Tax=Zosterops borbonicus TaxID=364589 RepID=A0A8K1LC55_9PASS|nr:hypothetical protein HGM15179_018429 [Zosterops borbonicus]
MYYKPQKPLRQEQSERDGARAARETPKESETGQPPGDESKENTPVDSAGPAQATPEYKAETGTKTLANLDKNHFLANARKKFLRDDDANLVNSLAISSTLRRNKQNEISIRLTHEIDIRKSFSRNETMRPDEIREGHRKEIRTIQPILDTWTA